MIKLRACRHVALMNWTKCHSDIKAWAPEHLAFEDEEGNVYWTEREPTIDDAAMFDIDSPVFYLTKERVENYLEQPIFSYGTDEKPQWLQEMCAGLDHVDDICLCQIGTNHSEDDIVWAIQNGQYP